ncbi:hypothetical protein TBLA_0G03320 [Henningerozyma blattae CBS 6284]|uniref:Uncharacterized protein n=1 Tax=Henningerozyma blattae (strain ATCC 34711 / CBS 6284 / DSM 70876 / NBRC 10599 / NRRL Y-10934 / UCD 77-7) TaxID=1071380 RepID=I2H7B7_HENB6|nr:hypothetical protein TBLA_0G03320 [Tetrapisispora blattae CBS 6284]CCH62269.1 hypothetical protein TBLA_0G03320 [Tetrapisispora blattae CBS 6284]
MDINYITIEQPISYEEERDNKERNYYLDPFVKDKGERKPKGKQEEIEKEKEKVNQEGQIEGKDKEKEKIVKEDILFSLDNIGDSELKNKDKKKKKKKKKKGCVEIDGINTEMFCDQTMCSSDSDSEMEREVEVEGGIEDHDSTKHDVAKSRLSINKLTELLNLKNKEETILIEKKLICILREELKFPIGEKTWIKDTSKEYRTELIHQLYERVTDEYPNLSIELIDTIIRRAGYSMMQTRLRRERRARARAKAQGQLPLD